MALSIVQRFNWKWFGRGILCQPMRAGIYIPESSVDNAMNPDSKALCNTTDSECYTRCACYLQCGGMTEGHAVGNAYVPWRYSSLDDRRQLEEACASLCDFHGDALLGERYTFGYFAVPSNRVLHGLFFLRPEMSHLHNTSARSKKFASK
jgi:hypothetical protein